MVKCESCNSEITLKGLLKAKGCCPSCGARMPVSSYCTHVPDRRWFRLYSATPLGLKLAMLFLGIAGNCAIGVLALDLGGRLYCEEGDAALSLAAWIVFLALIIFGPMMWAAVRGRIPCVSMVLLAGIGLWAVTCPGDCLFVIVPLLIFLLPFFLPSTSRWRRKCRDEDLAYAVALKSGEDLSSLAVVEYPRNVFAITIFLVVTLGLFLRMSLLPCEFDESLRDEDAVCRFLTPAVVDSLSLRIEAGELNVV